MHTLRTRRTNDGCTLSSLRRRWGEAIIRGIFGVVLASILSTVMVAQQPTPDKETCGLISHSSTLPGVTLAVTSKKCSFSQSEMRKGVRIDYEIVIDREIRDVVALPQDMMGCQKPGPSGLITFRVIRGKGHSFCPQCDLGSCHKPPALGGITLKPGRYTEEILWNGRNFTGNGEGMSTIQPIEFPPGSYVLQINARGKRQSSERRSANIPSQFAVSLEYRITITPNSKEEQQINSGGGLL